MKNKINLLLALFFFPIMLISGEFYYPMNQESACEDYEVSPFLWPWSKEEPKKESPPPLPFVLDNILDLEKKLSKQVFGQPVAVQTTVNSLITYRAGIHDPNRPIAVFLYIGPSGVGKTELAKCLAKEVLGNQNQFIRLNMSEYNSGEMGVIKLIGSPATYIGSDKGGQLSNPILKYPYSIVLLDEIEKAHMDVRRLFLHIFDEGYFKNGLGQYVDCRNCIFIITTNLGAKTLLLASEKGVSYDQMQQLVEPELMTGLTPEVYNRCEPILFQRLNQPALNKIIDFKLEELSKRVFERKGITILFDESVFTHLKAHGYNVELGARPINRIIKNEVTIAIAKAILYDDYEKGDTMELRIENATIVIKKIEKPASILTP